MDCIICMTTLTPEEVISLDCKCSYCKDCLCNWYLSQADEVSFAHENSTVKCPTENCPGRIESSFLLKLFETPKSQTDRDLLNTLLECWLKIYLVTTPDIRTCPGNDCQYSGIISKDKCSKKLECPCCSYRWRDKLHYNHLESIGDLFTRSQLFFDEVMTEVYEMILTDQCPSCSIPISKSGGCFHMTCKKCKYEFCWYCKHKFESHNPTLCVITLITKFLLIAGLILSTLLITENLIMIVSGLYFLIRFIFVYVLLFNFIPVSIFLIVQQLLSGSRQRNIVLFKVALFSPIVILEIYLLVRYQLLLSFFITIGIEVILFGVVVFMDELYRRRLKFIL